MKSRIGSLVDELLEAPLDDGVYELAEVEFSQLSGGLRKIYLAHSEGRQPLPIDVFRVFESLKWLVETETRRVRYIATSERLVKLYGGRVQELVKQYEAALELFQQATTQADMIIAIDAAVSLTYLFADFWDNFAMYASGELGDDKAEEAANDVRSFLRGIGRL